LPLIRAWLEQEPGEDEPDEEKPLVQLLPTEPVTSPLPQNGHGCAHQQSDNALSADWKDAPARRQEDWSLKKR